MSYTIAEYGRLYRSRLPGGRQNGLKNRALPEKTFDELERFLLTRRPDTEDFATQFLSLSIDSGERVITACNYVGVITTHDKTSIEILPKIAGACDEKETKKIFLEMLKVLGNFPCKDFDFSNLDIEHLNLLEIFIQMFLCEVRTLVAQGLKSAYNSVETNEYFFKGKLLATQNIRYNLFHNERFLVRYDEFSRDRAENRVIKTTLRLLLKLTTSKQNFRQIVLLLGFFDEVAVSYPPDADLSRCIKDRTMEYYERAILWCRVFLKKESFTPFAGSAVAFSLLFPMEKVFESFVAHMLRKGLSREIHMQTQASGCYLFDEPRKFPLRPDIVLKNEDKTIVLDTKWKLINRNADISSSDMYQVYAYGKRYNAQSVYLVYPCSDEYSNQDITYTSGYGDNRLTVTASFINLRQIVNQGIEGGPRNFIEKVQGFFTNR